MQLHIHPVMPDFDRLYKQINDLFHNACRRKQLSDSAHMVLYVLCELGDGCLQKDICDRCFISKQTVHSAVRKLERDGFLCLRAGRGRDMHLFLTEQGRELVRTCIAPITEAEFRAMEGLSREEQQTLLHLLERYASCLERELKEVR